MPAEQTITPLAASDQQRLEAQRAVVLGYVAEESRGSLQHVAGKLGLIRALLEARVFRPDQTHALQSLGVVLGDALVQQVAGAEWAMVEDEHGRDPAVRIVGTSILLFPLTMVSKRVEAGDEVDVFDLFEGILDHVERLRGDLAG